MVTRLWMVVCGIVTKAQKLKVRTITLDTAYNIYEKDKWS